MILNEPITEEWLKSVGFKWHQFDRQPDKQLQAILLEFPVSEPMTVSEDRFNKLANRVKALEEGKSSNVNDLASSDQSRKMDRTTILSAVAIVITLILGFVGATHTIDSEIANKIGPLDTRITKAEGAIKALADQQKHMQYAIDAGLAK